TVLRGARRCRAEKSASVAPRSGTGALGGPCGFGAVVVRPPATTGSRPGGRAWRQRANLLDGLRGDGGEEVDEVAVGVAEQQRPVAPGHRGGLVDEVGDEAGQVLVNAV